ncbi:hypothetical protein LR48_Vigan05g114200 [Vigna angularis]|uniref:Uncharacterized protein n=1 Tax=Phaseolus angularis TaxID=3914 RepID=A0A0L9ULB9_PHAAN|nr:hypothetical protein LR48_Vigan05g114200 [Vigna angularis]
MDERLHNMSLCRSWSPFAAFSFVVALRWPGSHSPSHSVSRFVVVVRLARGRVFAVVIVDVLVVVVLVWRHCVVVVSKKNFFSKASWSYAFRCDSVSGFVKFHNLAKISRPNKNKKRKEGMEVEDGRPWGITISVVEVQRPVEQRRTTNNHGSRCSLLRHDALADELAMLKQVNEFAAKGLSPPRKNGFARCQLWEKDMEIREVKDQIKELVGLLRQSTQIMKNEDVACLKTIVDSGPTNYLGK